MKIFDYIARCPLFESWESVSCFYNGLMVIIALVSAYYAWRAYAHQRDRSKKAAACDLARYYADVVIKENIKISAILLATGIDKYIKENISIDQIHDFDQEELRRILKAKNINYKDFVNKIGDVDPLAVIHAKSASEESVEKRIEKYEKYLKEIKGNKPKHELYKMFLSSDFSQDVAELLNQLEWFSMNLTYGLADEQLLYQSLHQTFLATVWSLYPYISITNVGNEDKFFTNTIKLFEIWHSRLCKIKGEAETKQEKLRTQLSKTKPRIYSGKGMK